MLKYFSCISCSKKVDVGEKFAVCQSKMCKMTQKLTSCRSQWFLKLIVESDEYPDESICLSVFNRLVTKLVSLSTDVIDIRFAGQDDLVKCVLNIDKVKITYDPAENKLIDCVFLSL